MWIDNSDSRYIFGNMNSFKYYELVGDDMMVCMRKSSSAKVVDKDTVQLKFTFDKFVTLKDMLHVLDSLRISFGKLFNLNMGSR